MNFIKGYTILIAAILLCVGNAYAASINFEITTDYAVGDETATFNLFCTTDTDVQVRGYDFSFKYDQNEIAFESHENLGKSIFPSGYEFSTPRDKFSNDNENGYLKHFMVKAERGNYDFETLQTGTTKLGSFTFSITENAILDGAADSDFNMDLVSYMALYQNGSKISSTSSLGPASVDGAFTFTTDVGGTSAVPVPAAAWLLGSGLLGLIGIRKKSA